MPRTGPFAIERASKYAKRQMCESACWNMMEEVAESAQTRGYVVE